MKVLGPDASPRYHHDRVQRVQAWAVKPAHSRPNRAKVRPNEPNPRSNTTMTTTFKQALTRAGVTVPDQTIADITVPVLTGPQRQGDVGIFPRPSFTPAELSVMDGVPSEGVPVVRGEATGNTHLLMVDVGSGITWAAKDSGTLIAVVNVPEGAVAHLIHTDEHGVNAMGPGSYELRGKQEQAEQVRRVAD